MSREEKLRTEYEFINQNKLSEDLFTLKARQKNVRKKNKMKKRMAYDQHYEGGEEEEEKDECQPDEEKEEAKEQFTTTTTTTTTEIPPQISIKKKDIERRSRRAKHKAVSEFVIPYGMDCEILYRHILVHREEIVEFIASSIYEYLLDNSNTLEKLEWHASVDRCERYRLPFLPNLTILEIHGNPDETLFLDENIIPNLKHLILYIDTSKMKDDEIFFSFPWDQLRVLRLNPKRYSDLHALTYRRKWQAFEGVRLTEINMSKIQNKEYGSKMVWNLLHLLPSMTVLFLYGEISAAIFENLNVSLPHDLRLRIGGSKFFYHKKMENFKQVNFFCTDIIGNQWHPIGKASYLTDEEEARWYRNRLEADMEMAQYIQEL